MSAQSAPPAWLFSFVDLAFLLLIAMTQLAADAVSAPNLGEIIVPRIQAEESTDELPRSAEEFWQLRVYPPADDAAEPAFALLRSGAGGPPADTPVERIDANTLRDRLASLYAEGTKKPLLAPHEDSRSRDLLEAVGLMEEHWPSRRRAVVSLAGR